MPFSKSGISESEIATAHQGAGENDWQLDDVHDGQHDGVSYFKQQIAGDNPYSGKCRRRRVRSPCRTSFHRT